MPPCPEKTRVIGLGNPILRDDGVGIEVAREVARRAPWVDVVETETGGFGLMEEMAGWDRVILVDAIHFNAVAPGTVIRIDPSDLRTSLRLRSVHEVDLPTVLELGRRLGLPMPREVVVFGIQVEDARTFGEGLNVAVARGRDEVVAWIMALLEEAPDA